MKGIERLCRAIHGFGFHSKYFSSRLTLSLLVWLGNEGKSRDPFASPCRITLACKGGKESQKECSFECVGMNTRVCGTNN